MSLSANETFCVVFFSAVLTFGVAAQSLSALFCRDYNQNVLCDFAKGDAHSHIRFHEGMVDLAVVHCANFICENGHSTHYYYIFTGTVYANNPQICLQTDPSVVTNQ